WNEYLVARPYHWLSGLENPETAAAKPLFFAVDHRRHRTAGVDQEAPIPAILAAGGRLTVDLRIPTAALPAWRGMCLVHCHGDVALDINGHPAREIRWGHEATGAFRSEIFMEYVDQYGDKEARPKPEDCRVFGVDPSCLRPGLNPVALVNTAAGDLEVDRVNLALW
ncbi:MAG: hypothetical protein V1800_08285, partial [Candidatus Latescibacterota bacterium]